jgi:hypothetical protein
MGALAVCDGCGWTTPVENTGDLGVPQGWVAPTSHGFGTDTVGRPIAIPIRDCRCPICYRGRWSHSCRPEDRPPALFWIVAGPGGVAVRRWYDWCPECKAPPEHVQGPPTSWRVARFMFVIASIVTAVWMWTRIVMFALGPAVAAGVIL